MLELMKEGDFNHGVKVLQNALGISVDGQYGPGTAAAVVQFQTSRGLSPDGIAGQAVITALQLNLTPTMLTEQDYVNAAAELNVEVATIKAFADTETARSSFLPDTRPDILFERHQFYERLGQQISSDDLNSITQSYPDICNTTWGGYLGGAAEYNRLQTAINLSNQYTNSAATAYECASYGKFQIMGFYWKNLGYMDVFSFVRAAMASEQDHLEMFVRFIRANPSLLEAMRNKDWDTMAREYNGPGQVDVYAGRLENNYNNETQSS